MSTPPPPATHSGWPATEIGYLASENQLVGGAINSGPRLDHYASLDLSVARSFQLPAGRLEIALDLINALNADNACCRQLDGLSEIDGERSLLLDEDSWLPIVPVLRLRWD